MNWLQIILPLFLSAFICWLLIFVFIKGLFNPVKPLKIAGITLQGIIPARQQDFAVDIGRLVSNEFFSTDMLQEKVTDTKNFAKLKPEIETQIDNFLRTRLKDTFPMLSMLIGDKTINQLKGAFLMEIESLFPIIMNKYIANLSNELDIKKTVQDKISGFSMFAVKEQFYQSFKKPLIRIQLMAALIGFMLGFLHVLLNMQIFS
ncbi:MAG TPA: DUF445 domain-containing protein [Ferruginibacter sp.]|nr:DUF445 domain-containing protein [Ferruginibacter sp.]